MIELNDKDSYGKKSKVEFGVNKPNENSTNDVMVPMEQLQGTHGDAEKDGPPPNHIYGVLARYKHTLINELYQKTTAKI